VTVVECLDPKSSECGIGYASLEVTFSDNDMDV
jgi:hypothetical protein